MCGRFLVELSADEMREIVDAAEKSAQERSHEFSFSFKAGEIFPGTLVPVITANNKAQYMKWGFPSSIANKAPHINARSETAMTSKTFGEAMCTRRCVVPASAFYEWKSTGKKSKTKYEITLPGRATMYMAGIYSEDGRFAVLTREAAPSIIGIHDRMPVILPKSIIDVWLSESPDVISEALSDLQYSPVLANNKQPEQLRLFT